MANLTPIQRQYILHWGEMGTRWGINRTVAQIHALLYLSPKPLGAEEIATTLGVARSNVSTSIRELETWGLVRASHLLGERRAQYESMKDVWEMFRIIVEERKRREFDPTIAVVRECLAEANKAGGTDEIYARKRMGEMLEFISTMSGLFEEFRDLSPGTIRRLAKLRGGVRKLLHTRAEA